MKKTMLGYLSSVTHSSDTKRRERALRALSRIIASHSGAVSSPRCADPDASAGSLMHCNSQTSGCAFDGDIGGVRAEWSRRSSRESLHAGGGRSGRHGVPGCARPLQPTESRIRSPSNTAFARRFRPSATRAAGEMPSSSGPNSSVITS